MVILQSNKIHELHLLLYIYVYAIIIYSFSNIIIFITYQYLFKKDSVFLFIALPRP